MPQVSKNPLGKETNQEIQAALWWLLARLNSDDNIKDFLGGFLTNTEKIMLAKRLAIAFLANKNYDYKDISNALKVSTNTVYRIKDAMDRTGGNYKFFNEYHALLVEHAKRYCRKIPLCKSCPVRKYCNYYKNLH